MQLNKQLKLTQTTNVVNVLKFTIYNVLEMLCIALHFLFSLYLGILSMTDLYSLNYHYLILI